MVHRQRNVLAVVLAKARTHYPKCALLRDAGASISFTIRCGGYGSWLSPGSPVPGRDCEAYPASTASAPVTASALSVTVFSSDGACTEMFSAKKRANAT